MKREDVVPGYIYQHYKGNFYKVLAIAKHTETEEELVIYQKISKELEEQIWARPMSMFIDQVTWSPTLPSKYSKDIKFDRFKLVLGDK